MSAVSSIVCLASNGDRHAFIKLDFTQSGSCKQK